MFTRSILCCGALLLAMLSVPAQTTTTTTPAPAVTCPPTAMTPGGMAMTPEMHQRMMGMVQELLIWQQNTAVTTPQGVLVLQGNRLLQYGPNLALVRQTTLPVPAVATDMTAQPPLRSLLPPRILTTDTGVIVVRGQQIIQLNQNLQVVQTAMLPTLPPLTAAETAAVCPVCQQMAMMANIGMMTTTTMPTGVASSTVAGTPPACPVR